MSDFMNLSIEQSDFVAKALGGNNILVNACIGSGKTTAIQQLCNFYPEDRKILYLTYNKLLKIDAKSKIKKKNVLVTNYHGFAFSMLKRINVDAGIQDLVQVFNNKKPEIPVYDILIIDEYQDVEQEHAVMLEYIKSKNPMMQIIAVGDMDQKIYDKTTLDVSKFIGTFLGEHIELEFTTCFRLPYEYANKLSEIWNKKILGVNNSCLIEDMDINDVVRFLSFQNPKDVICLGERTGAMSNVLNCLEEKFPDKYNKKTVYASINDRDAGGTSPTKETAIFTTYDSSKGLERNICVIFDYNENYWLTRVSKPLQSYKILRNIFGVAASRGKKHIIFVNDKTSKKLTNEMIMSSKYSNNNLFRKIDIHGMFDFKYKEDIEKCYSLLSINSIPLCDKNEIHIKEKDELIDLSPCIGMYQECIFFDNSNIDVAINEYFTTHPNKKHLSKEQYDMFSLEEKILYYTSLETSQERYRTQVSLPIVSENERNELISRLKSVFTSNECVQIPCHIHFATKANGPLAFVASGLADVVKNNTVYELKYVSELSHEHFLQCACYMISLSLDKGILWNTRFNEMYEIKIPNKELFMDAVTKAITKGTIDMYHRPDQYIAVLDTETNINDAVMSIGIVIADSISYKPVEKYYYIISPECNSFGLYSDRLFIGNYDDCKVETCNKNVALGKIISNFKKYDVKLIFAYNASFDHSHLIELSQYTWYDIMKIAAYKQYNPKLPPNADYCKSGRIKPSYSAETIYRIMSQNRFYNEMHNAIFDAVDELKIMEMIGLDIKKYEPARIDFDYTNGNNYNNNNQIPDAPKSVISSKAIFSEGDIVEHKIFGLGIIKKIEYYDAPAYVVLFKDNVKRTILESFLIKQC